MPQQIVEYALSQSEKDTDTYAGKQVFPIRFPHVCTFLWLKIRIFFQSGNTRPI